MVVYGTFENQNGSKRLNFDFFSLKNGSKMEANGSLIILIAVFLLQISLKNIRAIALDII